MASKIDMLADKSTKWIGSIPSLVFHTLVFAAVFLAGVLGAGWNKVLLVLTTVVSLEAIYLAIFIQMTVNKNTQSLKEVEADIDEIQEDVDEIQEDIDEIQEGVETKSDQELALAAIKNELSHLMKSIENLSHIQTSAGQKPKSIRQRISKMLLRKN
jgi:methyl-accepting chemotaxis protein